MHTAFSRETEKKIYVQDRIKEASLTVRSVLLDDRGCFYICGDTRMARQVQAVLCQILGEGMDNPHAGESIVQRMKSEGRFQVTISHDPIIGTCLLTFEYRRMSGRRWAE